MKKALTVLIAAAFVTGLVGYAAAQTSTTPPAPAEKKADEKPAAKTDKMDKADKPAGAKKMASKTAKGTVKSASADSIVVAGKEKGKDAEWTFAVDPKTKIKKGGKDATAADLMAGDNVSVKYMEMDGKSVAQTVTARASKSAKKAENPCAAKDTKKP